MDPSIKIKWHFSITSFIHMHAFVWYARFGYQYNTVTDCQSTARAESILDFTNSAQCMLAPTTMCYNGTKALELGS